MRTTVEPKYCAISRKFVQEAESLATDRYSIFAAQAAWLPKMAIFAPIPLRLPPTLVDDLAAASDADADSDGDEKHSESTNTRCDDTNRHQNRCVSPIQMFLEDRRRNESPLSTNSCYSHSICESDADLSFGQLSPQHTPSLVRASASPPVSCECVKINGL